MPSPLQPCWRVLRVVLCLVLAVATAHAATLYVGMSRHEAEAAMGSEGNYLKMGDRAFLLYPNEVKLEFRGGRLASARGVELAPGPPEAAPQATAQPAPVATPPVQPHPVSQPQPVAQPRAAATPPATGEPAPPPAATATNEHEVYQDTFGKNAADLALVGQGPTNIGDIARQALPPEAAADLTKALGTQATLPKPGQPGAVATQPAREEAKTSSLGFDLDKIPWWIVLLLDYVLALGCFKVACNFAGAQVLMREAAIVALGDSIAATAGLLLTRIPQWGFILAMSKAPLSLPVVAMLITIPIVTSTKSFPNVVRLTLGTQFVKLIAFLVLLNVGLALLA